MSSSQNQDLSTPNPKRNSDSMSSSIDQHQGAEKKPKMEDTDNNNSNSHEHHLEGTSTKGEPSKVLHVRNLPIDCTEAELITAASPFGKVENVLILKGKNQAFIEMDKTTTAASLLEYYSSIQASIRGRPIFFQYSTRTEVNPLPSHDTPSHILLVTVLNMIYPVTIDVLHQVFSKYGVVQKIVIFQKKAGFQALIQYGNVEDATVAKRQLDGQNIYSGCCTLRVQYSSTLTDLNIKVNNERTRDFVNPLPTVPSAPLSSGGGLWNGGDPNVMNQNNNPYFANNNNNKQVNMGGNNGNFNQSYHQTVCFVRNLDPERVTPDTLFTLFGVYGDVVRVKILFQKPNSALIQFANGQQCQTAIQYLNGCPLHNNKLLVNSSNIPNINVPRNTTGNVEDSDKFTKDFTNSPLHRYRIQGSKNYTHICQPSQNLHVSNLDPGVTEEMLSRAFAQYGDVTAIRMLSSDNKKMAIVQMSTLSQAVDALIHMHNAHVENTPTFIRVSFSKSKV